MPADSPKPSLTSIALTFASISSTAFGGGQKASVRQQVLARGWMDRERFMDGLEIAEVLPGPNILNLAIYCGQRVRGIPGAVAAFLGASIPPFIIVLIARRPLFQVRLESFRCRWAARLRARCAWAHARQCAGTDLGRTRRLVTHCAAGRDHACRHAAANAAAPGVGNFWRRRHCSRIPSFASHAP